MPLVKRFGPPTAGAIVEIAPDAPDGIDWHAHRISSAIQLLARELGRPPLVALSGGTTPGPIYERLADTHPDVVRNTVWCQTDERDVPPDHTASNQGMICRTLFGVAPGNPPANFLAVPLPTGDPRAAALRYSHLLTLQFAQAGSGSIDLVLLGIGEDGHTASLFPTANWRELPAHLFCPVDVPAPVGMRYSLTLPGLVGAKQRIFIVTGEAKAEIMRRILHEAPAVLPAGAIVRAAETRWLLDSRAAAKLAM